MTDSPDHRRRQRNPIHLVVFMRTRLMGEHIHGYVYLGIPSSQTYHEVVKRS